MASLKEPGGSCVEFLQWALPRMGYAWPGFRRVHRQVCKRIGRRLRDLRLGDMDSYRRHLSAHPAEWRVLDGFCRIPISRFARDREVFECLGRQVLPFLAASATADGRERVAAWSVGCARGEEPYTLSAVWDLMAASSWPRLSIDILATDIDDELLRRAREGVFGASSLRELPPHWKDLMFARADGQYRIQQRFSHNVRFERHDVRDTSGAARFDLILCRNLVLTYFGEALRNEVLRRLVRTLREDGAFVSGVRERIPPACDALVPWHPELGISRRTNDDRG